MSEAARRHRETVVQRAVHGPGLATSAARRAAFDNTGVDERARALLDKVARRAWTVTDADVAATQAAGMLEDEVFELTVCAALGQATRQLEAALAALDAASPTSAGAAPPPPSDDGARR
jgi:hypothetical protein